uniref:Uncharacterized protein n=1 Tax=Klebsiella pneumoniae TaxID=573 RepID=A0A8B0SRD4_KLEPN|nr:hypothetical protein [Klebsiella pneumoniae]
MYTIRKKARAKLTKSCPPSLFHGNELSYGERIAEISSRFPRNALSGAYTYWIIF